MWLASGSEEEVIIENNVEDIDSREIKELGVHIAGAVKNQVFITFPGIAGRGCPSLG